MSGEPSNLTVQESPDRVRQALQDLCAATLLTGADVTERLGVRYSTVASWRISSRSRSEAKNLPSPENCRRIAKAFPKIANLKPATTPRKDLPLQPRRRDLRKETWWRDAAALAATRIAEWDNAVGVAEFKNQMLMPYWGRNVRHPANESAGLRDVIGLGDSPIADVRYAIERLLVPVVHVPRGDKPWATLVSRGSGRPAILFGQAVEPSRDLRHALLMELGFHLVGGATRASAKHHAASHFADEFLLPATALEQLLVNKRSVVPSEIEYIANLYGAPAATVRRQCARIGREVDAGDGSASQPATSYLAFLHARLIGRAFQVMPSAPPTPAREDDPPAIDTFNILTD